MSAAAEAGKSGFPHALRQRRGGAVAALLMLGLLACTDGPTITGAEVLVSWSEVDDDFRWWAWALVEHPKGVDAIQSVEATLTEEDGPSEVELELVYEGERWEVEGLQRGLGLDCCTDYRAVFVATDVHGATARREELPRIEFP